MTKTIVTKTRTVVKPRRCCAASKASKFPPLNQEEREFAVAHHDLVYRFLHTYRLPVDEWYDVVIFRYLSSVYRWFNELELHYYSFSTVAFGAMRSAVYGERRKQKKRIKTISLDAVISGCDGVTYIETITRENLNYFDYWE